jgi:polysaccharide pyruvyl transferase WcaK-like protein
VKSQNKTNPVRVLIWGYYGCLNAGDDILLTNLCALIRCAADDAVIYATVNDHAIIDSLKVTPLPTPKRSRFKILNLFSLIWARLKSIHSCDVVLFGGGTQIFDKGKNSWFPILIFAVSLAINKLIMKRPVLHLCIGIGPIQTQLGRFFTRAIIRCSDLFVVRDKDSCSLLERLGCASDKIVLSCDLAYFFPPPPGKAGPVDAEMLKVAVSAFPYYEYVERDPATNKALLDANIEFVDKFLQLHPCAEIHFIAMQGEYANNDHEFAMTIRDASSCRTRIYCHPYTGNIDHLHTLFAEMDIALGMRLHFNILCYLHGIPVISLAYQQKVASEAVRFAVGDFVLNPRTVTGESICQAVGNLLNHRDDVKRKYHEAIRDLAPSVEQGKVSLSRFLSMEHRN